MEKPKNMWELIYNIWTPFQLKIGVLFSFIWLGVCKVVGGFDDQITALVVLVALDIACGFIAALKTHTFLSSIATRGLWKKAIMFLIIGLGVLLDTAMHTNTIRTLFIGAFAIIEVMSIVENVDRMGYGQYIPEYLRNCLGQIAKEKHIDKVEEEVNRKDKSYERENIRTDNQTGH